MKENLLSKIRKFGRFLEVWDWIWSLPLSIFLYWFFGWFFGNVMGMSVGSFDLSFVQPLFLAVTVVIASSTASIYVIRFHYKTIYKFIYSKKGGDPELSSVASFKALQGWQKIGLTFLLYLVYFLAVVAVYLTIL